MKRLALLVVVVIVVVLFFIASAPGSDGPRVPGSWPKPAEQCNTTNRGTIKWVRDQQKKVWVQWRCRCNIAAITVCHWQLIQIRRKLYLRQQLPNGTWYTPAGWHRDLHWVTLRMSAGGFCGYIWPTWHYVPARLR